MTHTSRRTRLVRRPAHSSGHTPRCLLFEHLDARWVLTGITDMAEPPQLDPTSTPCAASNVVTAASDMELDDQGVVHIHTQDADSSIVIRQYVNYQAQEVLEVEWEGQWTTLPADHVTQLQIHVVTQAPRVEVTEGVTVAVELLDPTAVDDALLTEASEPLAASLVPAAPVPLDTLLPEGGASDGPPGSGNQTLTPPVISDFKAELVGGFWQVSGKVTDDKNVQGLQVHFGGLLDGEHATVTATGTFSISVTLPPGLWGSITAVTTDTDGLGSNQAIIWVQT